jgi:hypothetical protein
MRKRWLQYRLLDENCAWRIESILGDVGDGTGLSPGEDRAGRARGSG